MSHSVALVLTTAPEAFDWETLARDVVDAGLAACIQCDTGITSIYKWQGQICRDGERRLLIKTSVQALPELQKFVVARHPYTVPQWLVLTAEASEAYGLWIQELTGTRA